MVTMAQIFGNIFCVVLLLILISGIISEQESREKNAFLALVFLAMLYIQCSTLWQMMGVSGLFRDNKNISIVGCVTNLVVSVALGVKLGMVGVFLGTTATSLVELVLKVRLLFRKSFHVSVKKYAARWCYYLLSFLTAQAGILWFTSVVRLENLFVQVLVNGVAAVVLSIPFCVLVFLKNEDFRFAVDLVRSRMPFGKRRKERKND